MFYKIWRKLGCTAAEFEKINLFWRKKKSYMVKNSFETAGLKTFHTKFLTVSTSHKPSLGKCRLYKSPKEKILWNNYLADELFFANFLKELGSRRTHSGKHRRLMGVLGVHPRSLLKRNGHPSLPRHPYCSPEPSGRGPHPTDRGAWGGLGTWQLAELQYQPRAVSLQTAFTGEKSKLLSCLIHDYLTFFCFM